MSIADTLPPSPPSTTSRRKPTVLSSSVKGTSTPDSPASFPGSSNAGSRKRVGFCTSANIYQPISSSQPLSGVDRLPLASSDVQSNLRSILKPGPILEKTVHTTGSSQDIKPTLSEIMDSFLEQLSQDDRSLSVDAYQTLANIIKSYDEIPEEDVLKAKINTFMKYIKRDLLRKPSPEEPSIADTNLMTQALRLLTIFVWNKNYAPLLPDETRTFILDRSIQVLAEHTASKNVIVFYLHLLAAQNFRQVLITGHRVARLLEALKTLTEHYRGNSIISERLLVYQKLFDQERPTMKAKANLWIQELLTGTTSSLKDIRTKAIDLGLKACLAFPPSSSISSVIRSTLAREPTPGKTFSSSMCRRLEKMITVREEGAQVPQIWAIVLRLCNNLDDRGRNGWGPHCDEWPQFKDWMNVIQKCFNCSDPVINSKAYQAWNHFIHIAQPHLASKKLLQILAKPMTTRLERHGGEAPSKTTRVAASSSYCTLLYYAFRPAATHDQYTRVWNEYIVQVMKTSFFEKSTANTDIASRIFMALFWNSGRGAKIWNENRGLESGTVAPEELPTIDCKWLRLKARPILDMFRVLMRHSSWGASGQSNKAYIAVAWVHFLTALREASRKEIKPSSETVEAMVHVTNFLGRLYGQIPGIGDKGQPPKPHVLNAAQIRQLTVTAVTVLGHDLMLAGLKDKGPGLSKALVIYDAIRFHFLEPQQFNDAATTGILEACLNSLDSALLHDFRSEITTGIKVGVDQLLEKLERSSEKQVVRTLTLLRRPTVLLLKEDSSGWQDKDQTDPSRRYPGIIAATLSLLARLPGEAVNELDETFASLFRSSHDLVVEDTVEMWNQQFGQLSSTILGPVLSEVLAKLQSTGAKISIQGGLQTRNTLNGHHLSRQALPDYSMQPESMHRSPSPTKSLTDAERSSELGSQHFQNMAAEQRVSVESGPHAAISWPRSRHDDSQIQFVPIESSPFLQEEPESQFLTAHQKEVRDRQRAEPAVVFPDLRSSPRPRAISGAHGDCEFARKVASQAERPATPTLPTNDDQGEAEIMASPTPRARHIANQMIDIEVPSSPPSMMGHNDRHEMDSSPLQAAPADIEDRIDFAIEQPDEEHNTMDLDEVEVTRVVSVTNVATVELAAPPADADLEMAEPDTDKPIKLSQIRLAKDSLPSAFYSLEQPYQGEVAVTSNARLHEPSVLVAEPRNADEDLEQTKRNDFQSRDVEHNLGQLHGATSPSLRPITINITSDSTAPDVNSENMESTPTRRVRTDSDEVDMLSASQLSHDLDQHISQTAGDEADIFQIEANAESQSEQQGDDQDSSLRKERSRKRKSSNQKFTAVKRRKSSQASSQRSPRLIHSDSSVYDIPGEMLDCIEISPSQAVQAIAPTELSQPTASPRRRPGRPRKRPLHGVALLRAQHSQNSRIEVIVNTSQIKAETLETGGLDFALPENRERNHDFNHDIEIQELANTLATDSTERLSTEDSSEGAANKESPSRRIMASLQDVLDRLKSASPADFDLRTVDDLCFQIRFQAQCIAQQK